MSKWGNRFKKWFYSELEATVHVHTSPLIPGEPVHGTLHVNNTTTSPVSLRELTLTLLTTFKDITIEGNEFNREVDLQEVPIRLTTVIAPNDTCDVPFSFELTRFAPSTAGAPYSIEATLWNTTGKRVWFDVLDDLDVTLPLPLKRFIASTEQAGLSLLFVRNVIDPLGEERPYPFVEKYGFKPTGEEPDEFEVVKSFWRIQEDGIDVYFWLDSLVRQRTLQAMADEITIRHRHLTWAQLDQEEDVLGRGIRDTLRRHR